MAPRTTFPGFESLVQWGEEAADDPEEMQTLSNNIIEQCRKKFSGYRLTLIYSMGSTEAAFFCTILVVCVPKLSIAVLTLVVSCSLTPPVTELTIGRDTSETFVYSLPIIVLSLAMLCIESFTLWAEQSKRNSASKVPWIQVWIGAILLLGSIALAAYEISSQSDVSYKATQGLGATIAAGLWCPVAGLSDLLKKKMSME